MLESVESATHHNPQDVPQGTSNPSGTQQPLPNLITGPKNDYLEIGVPLYEASIKCDWEAARKILLAKPELVRYSITENGETALHIAASAKGRRHVEQFVRNLVAKMTNADLELVNKNHNTALYLAAAAGNLETVQIMVDRNIALLQIPGSGTLPLYAAALFGNYEVVKYLYKRSKELSDDSWNPQNRGWLLEKCVESDMFDVALDIVKKYPKLGRGSALGVLAKKPEVFSGQKSNVIGRTIKSVFAFISSKGVAAEDESEALQLLRLIWGDIVTLPKKAIDDILRGPRDPITSGRVVQTLQLRKLIFDLLDKLEKETHDTIQGPEQVSQLKNLVCEHVVKMHVETQALYKQDNKTGPEKGDQAMELQKRISDYILKIHDEILNLKHKLGKSPDLIWKINDNGLSVFHIAVKHRHEGIYNLLYEIGSMKDMITPMKDEHGNNMLHLVGKTAKQKRLEDVSGVALQMQRELLWFQEVSKVIPPSYRERKNDDDMTPHELFTKEHKELVTQGEKWMKGTANQCMVVAALIATIVFAAAFTVPGGYSQSNDKNNGIPVFYSKATFVVFVVADAISLFASSASILIFLSILTSRYAERDFLTSIPNKLMAGLATLFISIATMTLAFGVSFFVLYKKGFLWVPVLIGVFALLPVILYLCLQYGLFSDIIRSTYGSRYLFKPKKHLLYYENPKV